MKKNFYIPPKFLKNRPPYLYKYKSLNDWDRKDNPNIDNAFAIRIFTNNELFFSPFKSFNDPFDCRAYFQINERSDSSELIETISSDLIDKMFERHPIGKILKEETKKIILAKFTGAVNIRKEIEHYLKSEPDTYQKFINEKLNEEYGVCSLSNRNNSILMYSHYADCHRGFCLRFRTDHEFFKYSFPVEYKNKYPIIDINSIEPLKIFYRKSKEWDYEEEYRLISFDGPGRFNYPPELLNGIVFGCNMQQSDKQLILKWIIDKPQIELFEARPKLKEYALDIVPIERND